MIPYPHILVCCCRFDKDFIFISNVILISKCLKNTPSNIESCPRLVIIAVLGSDMAYGSFVFLLKSLKFVEC